MSKSRYEAIAQNLSNNFKIPDWAGKPPPGLHLDVMKDGKLIQKLMIDEKKCYFFGRNRQLCDFPIDHQSGSRVHGALVWHKDLHRPFLIDLSSVHGTFIGSIRLEGGKPQQIPIDSKIHFGASTRMYVIRERPGSLMQNGLGRAEDLNFNGNLPDDEEELDNLTEFNTAQNRRNTSIINNNMKDTKVKRPLSHKTNLYVHFTDQEEIINPEDIDPSIGRFRNLVQETFIPNKRQKLSTSAGIMGTTSTTSTSYLVSSSRTAGHLGLTKDSLDPHDNHYSMSTSSVPHHMVINPAFSAAAKLGLPMPNLAPEVDNSSLFQALPSVTLVHSSQHITLDQTESLSKSHHDEDDEGPRKKKYAKEAWPGKKPVGGFSVGPI